MEKIYRIKGLNFGIDSFGKSAPYKDLYDNFKLNSENIIKKIKTMKIKVGINGMGRIGRMIVRSIVEINILTLKESI